MYVPLEKEAIMNQFTLTNQLVVNILAIYRGKKDVGGYTIRRLRAKRILMPNSVVLTDAGMRIAERLSKA